MPATRRVVVEIEVPEGASLEEILRGVKYRVVDRSKEMKRVLEKYTGILGEARSGGSTR